MEIHDKLVNVPNTNPKRSFAIRILKEIFNNNEPESLKTTKPVKKSDADALATAPHSLTSMDDLLISEPLSAITKPSRGLKLTVDDVKFVDNSDWINDEKCYVCERGYDRLRLINPHHCRICAHGICGDCSHGRINDQRVCDICMKKELKKEAVISRDEQLRELDENTLMAKEELETLMEESHKVKENLENFREEMESLENDRDKAKMERQKEKEQSIDELQALKENNYKLQLDIKDEEAIVAKKENTLEKLALQLSALKLEISQKKALFEEKQGDFHSTKRRLDLLKEQIKQNQLRSSKKCRNGKASSAPGKKYNLIIDNESRKYSLSTQPVFF